MKKLPPDPAQPAPEKEAAAQAERARPVLDISARKDFLAMLAHELRNPLAPLRNALRVLKARADDPQTVEQMGQIMERQLKHLSRIVDDLLDVSRLSRSKVELKPELIDFGRLVQIALEDHSIAIEQSGVLLELDLPSTPVWARADATRLFQVLDNLLSNALKFTRAGDRILIRLEQLEGELVLHVEDTGVGMSQEVQERLFEPFSQAEQALDRPSGGLGLGLALIKGIVELHGGHITAFSAGLGHGAQFRIRLPREQEPAALSSNSPHHPVGDLKARRILVVEDNYDQAESLRMFLELAGCEVTVAHTGPEGVEAAQAAQPDVVLCDIGLPGLDGFEVASLLKSDPRTAGTRLIAVTGYGREEDRRRALAAGFEAHLVKPVDSEHLLSHLQSGPAHA